MVAELSRAHSSGPMRIMGWDAFFMSDHGVILFYVRCERVTAQMDFLLDVKQTEKLSNRQRPHQEIAS